MDGDKYGSRIPLCILLLIIFSIYGTVLSTCSEELKYTVEGDYRREAYRRFIAVHVILPFLFLSLWKAIHGAHTAIPKSWPWDTNSAAAGISSSSSSSSNNCSDSYLIPSLIEEQDNIASQSSQSKPLLSNTIANNSNDSSNNTETTSIVVEVDDTTTTTTTTSSKLIKRRRNDNGKCDTTARYPNWVELKKDGRQRFCRVKTCRINKPDRTHHCSTCQDCIIEMDHHCPWIRNCVGYQNRKYFVCVLFYALCLLLIVIITMNNPVKRVERKVIWYGLDISILISYYLSSFLAIILAAFSLFHCWLIVNAFTTLEFCEKRGLMQSKLYYEEFYRRSPFDLGMYRNICHVLGPYPPLWLLPIRVGMCSCGRNRDCICGTRFDYNPNHPAVLNWKKQGEK